MLERSSIEAKDVGTLAKALLDPAVDDSRQAENISDGKNPAAVALGRLGGLKGGKARAASLSAEERSEIARKAAKERWGRRG